MKHESIQPDRIVSPALGLTDQEIEARVFNDLETQNQTRDTRFEGAVSVLRYPDDRTLRERIAAWWYLRSRPARPAPMPPLPQTEPVWTGHWATVKYL